MEVFAAVEADIISLFLIWIMVFYGKIQERNWRERSLFGKLLMANALLSASDIIAWVFEGATFKGANLLLHTSTLIYNISMILIGVLWLCYCDNQMMTDKKGIARRRRLYMLPFAIVVLVNVINVKTGWIFYYDSINVYHRGEFYIIHILTAVLYIITAVGIVLVAASAQERAKAKESYALLGFVTAPAITIAIQASFYGVSLIPFGITISLLMIFLQRIIAMITKDHLTGLDNQRAFEKRLEEKVRSVSEDEKLFVMMIDADYFKTINDTFGHDAGDEALVKIANCLRMACCNKDYIARLGGDEFVIIGTRRDEEQIEDLSWSIQSLMDEETRKSQYLLSVSTGYEIYDDRRHRTGAELYKKADDKMYEQKRLYHQGHR